MQNAGVVSTRVGLDSLQFNPTDEFVTKGPYDKALNYWTKVFSQNPKGYNTIAGLNGQIEPIRMIINSGNMLANGHHRVYVMQNIINNAPIYIKVFLTK